jgi:UDP-3-O-[3-hydroxymyristoyl] glucosamine N-acyltransferase
MDIPLKELMEFIGARLATGSSQTRITGFASLLEARVGDLSFFSDVRYQERLAKTRASAVLVPEEWTFLPPNVACLKVENPSLAFEKVVDRYGWQPEPFTPGIHTSAVVGNCPSTNLDKIKVGANAVIEDGVEIGDGSEVGAGCFIGRNVVMGTDCKLFANSTVHHDCVLGDRVILHSGVVIGADGFGYEFKAGRHRKIRQSGIVQLDSDVEIGAGSMVDRARFGRTWIGEGTKIDNLVQIGHNTIIGKHCIIVALSGISGSCTVGDYVVLAAQSGVAGHVNIGAQCMVGARSVVMRDLPAGRAEYLGFPAGPAKEEKRRMAVDQQLPKLLQRIRKLEQQLADKENASSG